VIGFAEPGVLSAHDLCRTLSWQGQQLIFSVPIIRHFLSWVLVIDNVADGMAWLSMVELPLSRPAQWPALCGPGQLQPRSHTSFIRSRYQHSHCLKSFHSLCCHSSKSLAWISGWGKELHHQPVASAVTSDSIRTAFMHSRLLNVPAAFYLHTFIDASLFLS
jgi:hypothetical protein